MLKGLRKRIKKRHIVVIAFVFAVYLCFALTRSSGHTQYIPFTGRVFSINSGEVGTIRIINGNTGKTIDYDLGDSENMNRIIAHLNSFRYRFWIPRPPIKFGGFSYSVIVRINGEMHHFMFSDNHIIVRGVYFFGPRNYFSELTNLVQGPSS